MTSLTSQELGEKRAELVMLQVERDDLDKRITVLERQSAYAKLWDRQKFGEDGQPRTGAPRKGDTVRCKLPQCGRDFYLRASYLKKKPHYSYCSRACYVAGGDHRKAGRKGGLEAWRRHPNMQPAANRSWRPVKPAV